MSPSKPPPPLVSAGLRSDRLGGCLPLPPSGRSGAGPTGRPASALTRDSLEGSSYVPAPTRRASAGPLVNGGLSGGLNGNPLKSSHGKSRPAPDAPAPRPTRPAKSACLQRRYSHLGVVVPEDYQEGERSLQGAQGGTDHE